VTQPADAYILLAIAGHAGVNLKTSASKTPKLPNAAAAVLLAPILTGADLPLGYRYQLNKIKEAT